MVRTSDVPWFAVARPTLPPNSARQRTTDRCPVAAFVALAFGGAEALISLVIFGTEDVIIRRIG